MCRVVCSGLKRCCGVTAVYSLSLSLSLSLSFCLSFSLAGTRVTADMSGSGEARRFNGLYDCVRKTAKAEGAGGLYKGLGPSLISIAPYLAIGFTMFDELKIIFGTKKQRGALGGH